MSRTAQSGALGSFVFTQLPPGTYTIAVELSGFKKVEKSSVILSVASRVNAGDFVLDVGNVTETITVEADAGRMQIQTESGERSDVVTNKQLRDIALNGRNVVDLMKLVPGVIAGGTITTSTVTNVVGGFNINGTRSTQHEYTVDGVTNLNLGNNTGGLVSVNPDALEEVKVLTSNYQAEYGRSGGGFIALTTRGGTSELRGGVRYFRRHDSLNANTFFNNARGGSDAGFPRPLYRFNYYGWDLGGPVPFVGHQVRPEALLLLRPGVLRPARPPGRLREHPRAHRGREGGRLLAERRRRRPADRVSSTPSPASRSPATSSPRTASTRPAARSSTCSRTRTPPSGGNVYNYTSQVAERVPAPGGHRPPRLAGPAQHAAQRTLRLQQGRAAVRLRHHHRVLELAAHRHHPGERTREDPLLDPDPQLQPDPDQRVRVRGRPRRSHDRALRRQGHARASPSINTPLLFPEANIANLIPGLTFGGIANVSTPVNTSVFGPFDQRFVINTFMNNLTKVAWQAHLQGRPLLPARVEQPATRRPTSGASIDFTSSATNPLNTGYPFANALLGVYNSYTQASSKPVASYFYYDLSGYIQDTWKPTSRLTLDLGLRLSHFEPYYNSIGDGAYFDPSLYDPAKAPRLYRPVCVALPCSGNNLRAMDPAVTGAADAPRTP